MSDTKKSIFDHIKDWTVIIGIITLIAGGATWMRDQGAKQLDAEQRQFTTHERKIEAEKHLDEKPSEVDNYKAYQDLKAMKVADSLNNLHAIQSRNERDSINQLNAEQIYQIKQDQDEQRRLTKELLDKINH